MDEAVGRVEFRLSEEFFESNYFQVKDKHVVLLLINYIASQSTLHCQQTLRSRLRGNGLIGKLHKITIYINNYFFQNLKHNMACTALNQITVATNKTQLSKKNSAILFT